MFQFDVIIMIFKSFGTVNSGEFNTDLKQHLLTGSLESKIKMFLQYNCGVALSFYRHEQLNYQFAKTTKLFGAVFDKDVQFKVLKICNVL